MFKKELFLLSALFSAGMMAAPDNLIWQLGKTDGESKEFIRYHPWEYTSAAWLRKFKNWDPKTKTLTYTITKNGITARPTVTECVVTPSSVAWTDDLVTTVKLNWNDPEGGRRLLTLRSAKTTNDHNGANGLEVRFPDGKKKVFSLPFGTTTSKKPSVFETVFDARKGANSVTIVTVTRAKHHRFYFDSIKLEKTNRAPNFVPVPEVTFDTFSGIAHPDQKLKLNVKVFNVVSGKIRYQVLDHAGKTVKAGNLDLKNGAASVMMPTAKKDYYTVVCSMGKSKAQAAYAVVEPVKAEYIPESRFGCHSLGSDTYTLRYVKDRNQIKMKRAFLGGSRWTRMHSVHWSLREPVKGKYVWDYLDERFDQAKKYKQMILLTIGQTPAWASPSKDRKLTVCGSYSYLYHPPKNQKDWSDFVTALVKRYKGRVQHYEIGNEPGYTSAFWTNGSAKDFGLYLKTAYEAIKKEYPEAVVYPGAPLSVSFLEDATQAAGGKPCFDVLSAHYLRNYRRGATLTAQWKNMLSKMGKKQELINSEDMSWSSEKVQEKIASTMIKQHVRDASMGVLRTFGFEMFDEISNRPGHYGFFNISEDPLPPFCAYRTMTNRLEYAKYAADLSTAEYEEYLFDRKGMPVTVFWSERPGKIRLALGTKSIKLINWVDQEKVLRSENGIYELEVGNMPQFIEGGDLGFLKTLSATIKALPQRIHSKPGKNFSMVIRLEKGASVQKIAVPAGWKGSFANSKINLLIPASAALGVYDASYKLNIKGRLLELPFIVEISGDTASNQIINGDFERGSSCWFTPKDKARFDILPGIGVNGSKGIRSKGMNFFGIAGYVKVRQGETYLFAYDIKGEGFAGIVYSIQDKNNKTIFPKRPGINALSVKATPEWRTVYETVNISQPGAAILKLSMLANYGDKTGKVLYIDNIRVSRITEITTPHKVLNQAFFTHPKSNVRADGNTADWAGSIPVRLNSKNNVVLQGKSVWKGVNDLSYSFRVMMDKKYFHLLVEVRDDVIDNGKLAMKESWKFDTLQFSIDPVNDNRDFTSFIAGKGSNGKTYLYKYNNYWTPELPDNITRVGQIKDASVAVKDIPGGRIYEISIPMHQLYPLRGTEDEIGFSLLVNDSDGNGRKYMEWSSGIGNNKGASQYGVLRLKK